MAMRFMWIPGIRPVIVPARRPSRRAIRISGIMYYFSKAEDFIKFLLFNVIC